MDEPRRKRIGTGRGPPAGAVTATLDPEDFFDVFGGPPRTVLLHKFSGDHSSSSSLLFRGLMSRLQGVSPTLRLSEVLCEDAFFGERMSRDRSGQGSKGLSNSKSKSNTSSVLSSEELSPLRLIVGEDAGLSSFDPKLRPINVPGRWNSTTDFPSDHQKIVMENLYKHSHFKSPRSGLSRRSPSLEPFIAEPNSNPSVKTPTGEEVKAALPSSITSGDRDRAMEEQDALTMSNEEDEISSSYVIEITPRIGDGAGKIPGIDEAIARDKERFPLDDAWNEGKESWGRSRSWKELIMHETKEQQRPSNQAGILCGRIKSPRELQMIEFKVLDGNMKMWTSGTEKDIRQLLSTVHQIMWPNSGWDAIPLSSLRESSQVKKAYQKARLCLHPDRLQQRGATFLQKYIAHKALAIIQDSWTKYISEGERRSSDHSS